MERRERSAKRPPAGGSEHTEALCGMKGRSIRFERQNLVCALTGRNGGLHLVACPCTPLRVETTLRAVGRNNANGPSQLTIVALCLQLPSPSAGGDRCFDSCCGPFWRH